MRKKKQKVRLLSCIPVPMIGDMSLWQAGSKERKKEMGGREKGVPAYSHLFHFPLVFGSEKAFFMEWMGGESGRISLM